MELEHRSEADGSRGLYWRLDTPANDDEARERLLDAADVCYARRGVTRTRIDHIAAEAGVHRTTVYSYFPNKNALVSASFVRSARAILAASQSHFCSAEPFFEQFTKATLRALDATRASPTMGLLLGSSDAAGTTVHAATLSEEWHKLADEILGPPLRQAVVDGYVRDDISLDSMLRWIWRVCFSLAAEPPDRRDGGAEGVLRRFLIPSVSAPGRGTTNKRAKRR